MLIKMAFRNLFRNEKRTLFTAMALVIGTMGIVVGSAWLGGVFSMFEEEGKKITGEVRITADDFEVKEKALDVSSNIDYYEIREQLNGIENIDKEAARIKFGSMVFKDDLEIPSLGLGIEEIDYKIIDFKSYIYEGRFLNHSSEQEILIGEKIKDKLKLNLGDEVTLLTSTQHGSISALNYSVVGFFEMDNSALNRSFYITISDAEYLLDMDGAATEYVVFTKKDKYIKGIQEEIKNRLDDNFLVKRWNEIGLNIYVGSILPFMRMVFVIVLGVLAGVGISNTMMMVVFERRKEIGVLKAMGMKDISIVKLLCVEGLIIGVTGALIGSFSGGGVAYYFSRKGVYLGDVLERVSGEMNLGTTVYMKSNIETIFFSLMLGIVIAFTATLLSVIHEVRREAVENLRIE